MIENQKQYEITKQHLQNFEDDLKILESTEEHPDIHPTLREFQINSVKAKIRDFKEEIENYEVNEKNK
jgi:hypothetical protein